MSDNELGKKLVEEEQLLQFLEAYEIARPTTCTHGAYSSSFVIRVCSGRRRHQCPSSLSLRFVVIAGITDAAGDLLPTSLIDNDFSNQPARRRN
jgi:hypothetical protein